MSKPMYRLVDGKGRVLIPKSMREAAKLEYGDIVCLGMAGGKITVRKVEVIEVGDQSPEAVEAYVRTAFQFMPDSLRLDLIGELSRLLQKRRGKIMQEFTEKDCMQTEKEISIQNRVVVLPSKVLPEHYTGQLFFCTNIQKTENPRHSIAHLVSLSTGEAWHCWNRDVVGVLLPELLGEKERLQLSQIRPFGALDLHGHSPEYSGYSFLPDGRYASGVWLANPEEVWSYVMMQKDYQYRILICDRDDFAVLEMLEGRMIFPDVQSLEQFQQAQKDGGMEMI